jgi:ferric-dicitrate binding protein FerR (iron transport regulator)
MAKKNAAQLSTAEISRQAAFLWLVWKDQRGLSLEQGLQFLLWLMRSRRHLYELLIICRQDARLTRLMRNQCDRSKGAHASQWQGLSSRSSNTQRRHPGTAWHVAAMVLLTLPMFLFLRGKNDESPSGMIERPQARVVIAAKEQKKRRLPDGSFVSLDAGARLRVDFKDTHRDVHLLHGRAMFDVVLDESRPFIVRTFLVDIAADSASKFMVKIDTSVEVAVHGGMVEVAGREAKAGAPIIRVKSGETYRVPMDRFRAIVAESKYGLRPAPIDG